MTARRFWIAKAARLAHRRNLARSLDVFLPASAAISAVAAAVLLFLRSAKMPTNAFWSLFWLVLALAAVVCWFIARRKFFTRADALIRLDEVGHLYNRLTAAQTGVGEWPPARELRDPTRWNWPRLAWPMALAVLLLTGAAMVRLPAFESAHEPQELPLAWTQVESWRQTLAESEVVEPAALEKLREQANELRQQPAKDWYSQSSLEAGETLRQQTEQTISELQRDLQKTEQALAAATKPGETLAPGELKTLATSLQQSLHGLEMGTLPLNKELLGELKELDAAKLKQLSQAQIAQMRDQLKAGTRVCEQCVGPARPSALTTGAQASGGKGGGGKTAPLSLKDDATNLHSKETEALANDDLSRALPGDLLAVQKGEHEVSKSEAASPLAAGAIRSPGEGGDAVWRESLTPSEREVLQRYFK